MPDLMPPVVVTLAASVTEGIAGITRFGEALGAMSGEAVTAGERTGAAMLPAEAGIKGLADTSEVGATKVSASNDRIMASFRQLSASADRTAEQWYVDSARMAASTQKMAADMEAAEARAIASTEAMGAKMDQVAATSTGFASKVEGASKRLMLVGAAGAVVGAVSVKMAADFESSTTRLVTSAGETEANLNSVRDGILGLAGQVGYSAEELSKAMYTIESGGQHGADGLKVLQAAAEGAKTENAELKTVADAVTSVLVDYHLKADSAASVTSKLVAATSAGKTTFEELSGAMSAVLPVASAAHVSLDDILGDMAAMTVHGMSAQQSAQNLTDVIRHMQSPTAVQSKELALLGINAQDLAGKLSSSGLSGTLQMIEEKIKQSMGPESRKVILDLGTALQSLPKDVQALGQKLIEGSISQGDYNKAAKAMDPIAAHQAAAFATLAASTHTIGGEQMTGGQVMQSYGQALAKSTGDATGLNVALMLTGENAGVTNNAIKTVAGASTEAGNHVKGWAEIQKTFNQKLAESKDGLGAMAIAIGERLLPAATVLIEWIGKVTKWFADNKVAADALAVVIGVLLLGGVVGLTAKLVLFGAGLVDNLLTPVKGSIGFLKNLATAADGTAGGALGRFVSTLGKGAVSAAKNFGSALVTAGTAMADLGKAAFITTAKIAGQAAAWVGQKIAMMASAVAEGVLTAAQWLLNIAMDANPIGIVILAIGLLIAAIIYLVAHWHEFTTGITKQWNDLWKACSDLITKIRDFMTKVFTDVIVWAQIKWMDFKNFWVDLWNEVWKWCSDRLTDIKNWVKARIDDVMGFFEMIGELPGKVSAWMSRTKDGIVERWNEAVAYVKAIPGRILDALGSLGSLLWNAGSSIINGLLSGLKAAWGGVTSFVSGIGNWIADHKGPLSYDRQLLVPHGNAIMDGLHEGLINGGQRVQSYLDRFTTGIGDTAISGNLNVSGTSTLAMNGGIGQGTGNVYVTVQGSIITERDLMAKIQTNTLRYDSRNSSNGLTLGSI